MWSLKILDLLSCSSHSCFALIHVFNLVLLTVCLLCAGPVLDTGNTSVNGTHETQVLMELTLGIIKPIWGSG